MEKNIQRFERWMNLQHYSPNTISEYKRELERFFKFLNDNKLDFESLEMIDIEDFIFSLEVSELTRNRALSAIKSFFKYLNSRGIMSSNPAISVKSVRIRRKNPVFLSEEEYIILMETLMGNAKGFVGLRDKLIIAFLLTTGVRVSEIVGIEFDDVTHDKENKITIEVKRKGQEMDYVYLNNKVGKMFDEYLIERKRIELDTERVFITYRKQPIDRTAVYRIVKKYLYMSGIDKKKMGPHVLRHTFATALMRKNISIYKIKELLNHKNISTTEKYLHVAEDDLRKVVENIDF